MLTHRSGRGSSLLTRPVACLTLRPRSHARGPFSSSGLSGLSSFYGETANSARPPGRALREVSLSTTNRLRLLAPGGRLRRLTVGGHSGETTAAAMPPQYHLGVFPGG